MIARYRYLFAMMGAMATYSGMVYNEFFAIKMNLFGSCYKMNERQIMNKGCKP